MSFRMLGYVIAFSSAFTLLGTSLQLYWEYRTEIQRIEDTLLQVSTSHRSGLSTSLWLLDETQIRGQLEGILNLPDITYVARPAAAHGRRRQDLRTVLRPPPRVDVRRGDYVSSLGPAPTVVVRG